MIVGAGPAGWSLAAALRREGVDVTLVAPAPHAPWPARYGAFVDELERVACPAAFVWPDTVVRTDARTLRLGRAYASVDSEALRAKLVREAAGTRVVEDTVEIAPGVAKGRDVYRGDFVVDARGASAGEAAQVAYGVDIPMPADVEGVDREAATLMDFTAVDDASETGGPGASEPTFLYALPRGDRVFVEETSLVGRPPMSIDALRAKLARRLARLGLGLDDARDEERCLIWMDVPPPSRDVEVVPFGAAAGFVHPATGYSIVRTLEAAPAVAAAIARGGGVEAAVDAMWPVALRRARALQDAGRTLLMDLDKTDTARFFEAFFATEDWPAYLAAGASDQAVARAMAAVFRTAPWTLKWQASRTFLRSGAWRALRPLR